MKSFSDLKKNCWEIKKCGREMGGIRVEELGVCPASLSAKGDGINEGKNSGRICWAVAGTLCDGKVQGEFVHKQASCMECNFFKMVLEEENDNFRLMLPGQVYKIPESE